jgi:hypothetical protein
MRRDRKGEQLVDPDGTPSHADDLPGGHDARGDAGDSLESMESRLLDVLLEFRQAMAVERARRRSIPVEVEDDAADDDGG